MGGGGEGGEERRGDKVNVENAVIDWGVTARRSRRMSIGGKAWYYSYQVPQTLIVCGMIWRRTGWYGIVTLRLEARQCATAGQSDPSATTREKTDPDLEFLLSIPVLPSRPPTHLSVPSWANLSKTSTTLSPSLSFQTWRTASMPPSLPHSSHL